MRDYNCAVFIARLQPPHKAHIAAIDQGLLVADHVIVVMGETRAAPDIRNPWTFQQRVEMLRRCYSYEERGRLDFVGVRDRLYNDTSWAASVHYMVGDVARRVGNTSSPSVVLVGHKKDHTSFYLDLFPQWTFHDIGMLNQGRSATAIREAYFREGVQGRHKGWTDKHWHGDVAPGVRDALEEFRGTEQFTELVAQQHYVDEYKDTWAAAPFPPTFVTTDAVVVQAGHVLLVRRGANPGKGKLALPGGFLDQDRSLEACALRELKEETRIKVDQRVLRAAIQGSRAFDHPERSTRGRTITHAFYIRLPEGGPLPEVKGGSDAKGALWMPLGDLNHYEGEFFEDHLDIIEHFTMAP